MRPWVWQWNSLCLVHKFPLPWTEGAGLQEFLKVSFNLEFSPRASQCLAAWQEKCTKELSLQKAPLRYRSCSRDESFWLVSCVPDWLESYCIWVEISLNDLTWPYDLRKGGRISVEWCQKLFRKLAFKRCWLPYRMHLLSSPPNFTPSPHSPISHATWVGVKKEWPLLEKKGLSMEARHTGNS